MRIFWVTCFMVAQLPVALAQQVSKTDTTKTVVPAKTMDEKFKLYYVSPATSKEILEQQVDQLRKTETKKSQDIKLQLQLQPKIIIGDQSEQRPMQPVAPTPQKTGMQQVAAVVISTPDEETGSRRRIITGPSQFDSRAEIRSLNPTQDWAKRILINARSVAIVVDRSKLLKISSGFYQIDAGKTLGKLYQLCPGEPFTRQPVLGTGTASITGTRRMLTAAHVFSGSPTQYAIVFGFEIYNQTGAYQQIIAADSVFFPQKILRSSAELDAAEFSVDRDLPAPPLNWSALANPAENSPVYMIGHPYGLPKKVTANASVQDNHDRLSFYTTLDAFQGNSGSPVFDLYTHQVIGILVGGETDYQWNGSCNVSKYCNLPYCPGEKVVRITAIKDFLN